jgi:hypothetical protein
VLTPGDVDVTPPKSMENNEKYEEESLDGEKPEQGDVSTRIRLINIPLIIVLVLILIYIALTIPLQLPMSPSKRVMTNCMQQLRDIGSAQLAYQGTNNDKYYGTFDALQLDGYIDPNATKKSLIEHYSMSWRVINWEYNITYSGLASMANNTFTVIAYPDRPGKLKIFLITEDQVVRKFTPENGNVEEWIYGWDPIL